MDKMPKWADVVLIPLISLCLAFIASGIVVWAVGADPFQAISVMVKGAVGPRGIGHTLYYATNYMFTGLAVAVAFHARMFNIGGEGQAAMGGLGAALVLLAFDWPHWAIALPMAIIGACAFGAFWAAIPAVLQAKRGSHIVITTIMFNFIAAAILGYLLNGILKTPLLPNAESLHFSEGAHLPTLYDIFGPFGIPISKHAPANISFLVALLCAFLLWFLLWRTRLGHQLRSFGSSPTAATYAGYSAVKLTIIAMVISGALSGMMAINVVMGNLEYLIKDFVEGAGFIGIAVALMGRSHPIGIILAALLFGGLTQGGFELLFEMPHISKEVVLVIQGMIILFTGALDYMVRGPVEKMFLHLKKGQN